MEHRERLGIPHRCPAFAHGNRRCDVRHDHGTSPHRRRQALLRVTSRQPSGQSGCVGVGTVRRICVGERYPSVLPATRRAGARRIPVRQPSGAERFHGHRLPVSRTSDYRIRKLATESRQQCKLPHPHPPVRSRCPFGKRKQVSENIHRIGDCPRRDITAEPFGNGACRMDGTIAIPSPDQRHIGRKYPFFSGKRLSRPFRQPVDRYSRLQPETDRRHRHTRQLPYRRTQPATPQCPVGNRHDAGRNGKRDDRLFVWFRHTYFDHRTAPIGSQCVHARPNSDILG